MKSPKTIILLACILSAPAWWGCSYRYLHRPFRDFSESTDLVGKNLVYCFEQLQEEEIRSRVAESLGKDSLAPEDLRPRVLSAHQLELRRELVKYLVNYASLLESLVTRDYRQDILENAGKVRANLENIDVGHGGFLSGKEKGAISALAAALPEALAAVRARKFILELMAEQQPVLERAAAALGEELATARAVINFFFDRQFRLLVSEPWGTRIASRKKNAELGAAILKRRQDINIILEDLAAALAVLPGCHARLRVMVRSNKGPVRSLAALVNYAAHIEALYREYANEKETEKEE